MKRPADPYKKAVAAHGSERGFALLVVVIVMLLLSVMASQFTMQIRTELQVASNVKRNMVARFLSEAGVNLGLFMILDRPMDKDVLTTEKFLQGKIYLESLPAGSTRYYAVSESGKIDLNNAPRGLLALFCAYHLLNEEQSATLIDSWADWRDADDFHRVNGAEEEAYAALAEPYKPRNGVIVDPAEFFLIHGTEPLLGSFVAEEVFTVHNPAGKINFNSLTPAMLDFVTAGSQEHKDAYDEARVMYDRLGPSQALEILGDQRYMEVGPYLVYDSGQNTNYFIVAEGLAGYSPRDEEEEVPKNGIKISALVSNERSGIKYLAWREDPL